MITTSADAGEIYPDEFVTVKKYVPAASSEITILVPVPLVITPPGVIVIVHVSEGGKPLKTTLPVASEHVG